MKPHLPLSLRVAILSMLLTPLAVSSSNAEELLNQDFTTTTTSYALPDNWTEYQFNGSNKPCFRLGEEGVLVNYSWQRNALDTAVTLSSSETYRIKFQIQASTQDQQAIFYLSSSDYSVYIGNSYYSNAEIAIGTTSTAANLGFVSFQSRFTNPTAITIADGTETDFVGGTLIYDLTLSNGQIYGTVSNGNKKAQIDYTLTSDFSFDRIGFQLDGTAASVGVQYITVDKLQSINYTERLNAEAELFLENKGSITFKCLSAEGNGGALYSKYDVSIRQNTSVLFQGNAEINEGEYRLRSIYMDSSAGANTLDLSTDSKIVIRDSIFADTDTRVKLNNGGTGEIVFTGETTEDDLNAVLAKNNAGRQATAEELTASRTSELLGQTTLYGGQLTIRDGAILRSSDFDVAESANATILMEDAALIADGKNISISGGSALALEGVNNISAAQLTLNDGATLLFELGGADNTTPLLTLDGLFDIGKITIDVNGNIHTKGQSYTLLKLADESDFDLAQWCEENVSFIGNSCTFNNLAWENGSLIATCSYVNESYTRIGETSSLTGGQNLFSRESICFQNNSVTEASGGAIAKNNNEKLRLCGNGTISFIGNRASSTTEYRSTCGGAIEAMGDGFTCSDNLAVLFESNKTESAYLSEGGAVYLNKTPLQFSDNESITFTENVAESNGSSAYGGAIYAENKALSFTDNGEITFRKNAAETVVSSKSSSASGGAIYSKSMLSFSGNGDIVFDENSANAIGSPSGTSTGGAIFSSSQIIFSDNKNITFNKNTADGSTSAAGGAIYAANTVDFTNNGAIIFTALCQILC